MPGRSTPFAVLLALGLGTAAWAQEAPPPETKKPEAARAEAPKAESSTRRVPTVTLRVTVAISRFEGEKKVVGTPFAFVVTAGGRPVRLRSGLDVPVPTGPRNAERAASVSYRTVGTNIDCDATDLGDGRFLLDLSIDSTSLEGGPATVEGYPVNRRFEARLGPVLRDGQTLQAVTSTDPVTGSTVKVDVSLQVAR